MEEGVAHWAAPDRQTTMSSFLADHIHLASVGRDIVILDVKADNYSCLVGGAAYLQPLPDGEVRITGTTALTALRSAGLLAEGRPAGRKLTPQPKQAARLDLIGRPSVAERMRFMRTALGLIRYERAPFSCLISKTAVPRRRIDPCEHENVAARHASLFAHWLPWVPNQGACLHRTFLLRQFLVAGGLKADWVFGVSTWPFSAHCWLQIGDLLLDDDVDRVGSYSPIMVV